jgi:type I restriction enzyme S subunit
MDFSEGERELPPGWAWAKLDGVCDINPPTDLSGLAASTHVTFAPMAAVGELTNSIDLTRTRPLEEVRNGFTRFRSGDLLFAKITPCMENGKIAIVPEIPHGVGAGSTEFHVLRAGPGVDVRYICHFVMQDAFRQSARRAMSGGVGQQRVPSQFLKDAVIPVPPSAEQARIVAAVNVLFEEVEAGEAALARARAGLETFRASLLHAACTGALTAPWRQANPTTETGAQLLETLLRERRARWEDAYRAAAAAKNKLLSDASWKARYPLPVQPDLDDAPELPPSWTWVSLDQLTSRITSGSRNWADRYARQGAALIRAQDIRTDALRTDDLARVDADGTNGEGRTAVQIEDILVTITGANVSRCARVCEEIGEAYVNQHIGLCSPVDPTTSAYIHLALICDSHGRRQLLEAAYGAGKPGLSLNDLRQVVLPLPPAAERAKILAAVADAQIEAPSLETNALRQSILHAAFTGRLVPQDPSDEPASALLARLRGSAAAAPRRGRRTRAQQPSLIGT